MIHPFLSTLSTGNTRMRKTVRWGPGLSLHNYIHKWTPPPSHCGAMTERSRVWWAPSRADVTWSGGPAHPKCSHDYGVLPKFLSLSRTLPQISAPTSSTSFWWGWKANHWLEGATWKCASQTVGPECVSCALSTGASHESQTLKDTSNHSGTPWNT